MEQLQIAHLSFAINHLLSLFRAETICRLGPSVSIVSYLSRRGGHHNLLTPAGAVIMITVESAMAAADTDADGGVAVALAVNLFCFMARNIALSAAASPSAFIQVKVNVSSRPEINGYRHNIHNTG